MNLKQFALVTAATLAGTSATFLRSTVWTPQYPCDGNVQQCQDSCKLMKLPFDKKWCNEPDLLSCTNKLCTMSKSKAGELMKEAAKDKVGAVKATVAAAVPKATALRKKKKKLKKKLKKKPLNTTEKERIE